MHSTSTRTIDWCIVLAALIVGNAISPVVVDGFPCPPILASPGRRQRPRPPSQTLQRSFPTDTNDVVAEAASISSSPNRVGGGASKKKKQKKQIDAALLSQLGSCTSGSRARQILQTALGDDDEDDKLFECLRIPPQASVKYLSDAELAIQTNIRNQRRSVLDLIETNGDADADRATLVLLGLFVGCMGSAVVASEYLPGPEIVRFMVVWLLSFGPLLFVGAGLAVPQSLQVALIKLQGLVLPSYKKRMIQHEAGHFLMGHLLGWPVRNYRADSAIKNAVEFYPLRDDQAGPTRASMLGFDSRKSRMTEDEQEQPYDDDRSYFSEGGRGDGLWRRGVIVNSTATAVLAPQDVARDAWPYRKLDERTLDVVAAVSLAGVTAEILACGDGQGGYADLTQLSSILRDNTDGEGDFDKMYDGRVRFALGYNFSQMRRHLGALDALVEVMERGGSVDECVLALESCDDVVGTVSGAQQLQGITYEALRKERLREEYTLLEKIVLGGGRNADHGENAAMAVTEGKGGGDLIAENAFVLTGDDPLYAALAVAFFFLVWASNGGLSLH